MRYTDPNGEKTYDCRRQSACPKQMHLSKLKVGDIVKTGGANVTIQKNRYTVTLVNGIKKGVGAAKIGPVLIPKGSAGANVKANEIKASHMSPFKFRDQVKNKGPWCYKQQGSQYEAFGNFNYGATGKAAGFPGSILLQEAGKAQVAAGTSLPQWGSLGIRLLPFTGSGNCGDDPVDQYWIEQGIRYEDY